MQTIKAINRSDYFYIYVKINEKIKIEFELTKKAKPKVEYEYLRQVESITILSIKAKDFESSGQVVDSIIKFVDKEQIGFAKELVSIWNEYHNNDIIAGTKAQMEFLKGKKAKTYQECCDLLESEGLRTDNGYRFGTNWLYKPLDEKLIYDFIEKYFNIDCEVLKGAQNG